MPRRHGFTMIELVVAILIGSILTSIAFASFTGARGRFAVKGARNTYASLHARARAQAIEQGRNVVLAAYPTGDSVVLTFEDGTRLERIDFGNEMEVDIRSTASTVELCMNPRGFADEGCTNFSSAVTLEFWNGADSATVSVLPLGQLVY